MRISIIGAGNVGTHLARGLYSHGVVIENIYSRTADSAKKLASSVDASPVWNISQLSGEADFYIFSIKDDILPDIIKKMPHSSGIWLHTAGSIPIDIFKGYTKQYGVLYPLQTFSKSRELSIEDVPFFLEASDEGAMEKVKQIPELLQASYRVIDFQQRQMLHLSAVFACNFTNHLYHIAAHLLENNTLSFDLLTPLLEETMQKAREIHPAQAQTGPAIRYDKNVIQKHLELLYFNPKLKEIYELLSSNIHKWQNNNS